MSIYSKSRDRKYRHVFLKHELGRLKLQFFLRNFNLSKVAKYRLQFFSSHSLKRALLVTVRGRNRCFITNRSGSIFRYFRLSRIMVKQLSSKGLMPGLRKSSW